MVLAIDQGSSGTTCLVVDGELRPRGRGFRAVRQYYPRPGWVEHDPEDIWQSVVAATEQALVDASVRAGDVQAIGITNQRETTLLW
ncbi:MAG: glycerol kinase, partial [Actinobacteria bacterium]